MKTAPNFARTVRTLLRERLLDAASDITCAEGWASVTMGKVAARVGVSRQTVYKELGSKPALAESLMLRETDRFLAGVGELVTTTPDPVDAVTAAVRFTLESAADNPLLKTVLSGSHGEPDDLLPLLTTGSAPVLERGIGVLAPMLHRCHPHAGLSEAEWRTTVEIMVRLVLSHLVQPTQPIPRVVEELRWVIERVLTRRSGAE
ncbi:TetR/AcrR family transcriptional regulator [Amycolatopsis anabasis]|uniref:TetR/AcrR family transcriptional regulator n=1 Tax=Amycolatopsis anabasis TaxID=1840409 RepID=UPI001FEA4ED5|nr:TetR family transcriptional regulator [Amycolatopsis anabasis]